MIFINFQKEVNDVKIVTKYLIMIIKDWNLTFEFFLLQAIGSKRNSLHNLDRYVCAKLLRFFKTTEIFENYSKHRYLCPH